MEEVETQESVKEEIVERIRGSFAYNTKHQCPIPIQLDPPKRRKRNDERRSRRSGEEGE